MVSFIAIMTDAKEINQLMDQLNCCVLMPTYNNERTLERVLLEIMALVDHQRIVVVNDGATDATASILAKYTDRIKVLTQPKNGGKGKALRKGFSYASEQGFSYALTIDSDGQHYPDDIPLLLRALKENPGACIMGSRNMAQEGVPQKSSFGNKFSNFWFFVETGIKLPDTQTGFRIYPLNKVKKLWLVTTKFELEIEVIVKLAWRLVPFVAVPIRVKYDPNERVSHFRPGKDFTRISILNTFLVIIALLWYYPRLLFAKKTWKLIAHEAIKPEESNMRKASSLAFGVFMGIVPLWGFQLLLGIPLAVLFRLNKILFITAANISIPPMIPFILYVSFVCGQLVLTGEMNHHQLFELTMDSIQTNALQYVVGACVFAVLAGVVTFVLSFGLLKVFRKGK
jgi:glycosyltransferase involved in cell wall biosynthesis